LYLSLPRQHLPNGQISNALGGKCIGADGDAVSLVACDSGSTWQMQGNGSRICIADVTRNFNCSCISGQLKLGSSGEQCLSQKGFAAGTQDVALRTAVSASDSFDNIGHGANMAVDGSSSTFWA
jgi:hypothetical protein